MDLSIVKLPMVLIAPVNPVTALAMVFVFMTIPHTGNVLLTPTAPTAGYV
jgi:hypothetical protein